MGKWSPTNLRRDESGVAGLALAMSALMVFGFAALAIDLGLAFFSKRNLQAVTDVAAIAAINSYINGNGAASGATAALTGPTNTLNFYAHGSLISATLGNEAPVANLWTFTAGAAPINAVQVKTSASSPLYFARVFLPAATANAGIALTASATAMRQDLASFCAGTGLLNLNTNNSTILNDTLGTLLGTSLNLSLVSYQGLANTQINALSFLDALATEMNLTAGTYSQVLSSTVSMSQVIQAEIDALNAPGSVATVALNQLKGSLGGNPSIQLGQLIQAGLWANQEVASASATTAAAANINLFSLVTGTAQLANGQNAAGAALGMSLPGIASVNLQLTVGEKLQCAVAVPVGTQIHTAQVRLYLTITLLPLLGYVAQVPLYIEVADGTVTLANLTCGVTPATNTDVTLDVTTGLLSGWIGQVTAALMTNFSSEPFSGAQPPPAPLVNVLGLVTIDGQATITPIPNAGPTALQFTATEIGATPPYFQTVGTPVASLTLGPLSLTVVSLVGVLNLVNQLLVNPILAALEPLLGSTISTLIDSTGLLGVVNDLLNALGISVGTTSVTVTGARCGVPSLVL